MGHSIFRYLEDLSYKKAVIQIPLYDNAIDCHFLGKWDNMVGGGLSVGHGILETAHKEAMEEASVPEHILSNLISVGCVSYATHSQIFKYYL